MNEWGNDKREVNNNIDLIRSHPARHTWTHTTHSCLSFFFYLFLAFPFTYLLDILLCSIVLLTSFSAASVLPPCKFNQNFSVVDVNTRNASSFNKYSNNNRVSDVKRHATWDARESLEFHTVHCSQWVNSSERSKSEDRICTISCAEIKCLRLTQEGMCVRARNIINPRPRIRRFSLSSLSDSILIYLQQYSGIRYGRYTYLSCLYKNVYKYII